MGNFCPAQIGFLEQACQALGIDPDARPVYKIVIEIAVDDAVKVHIQEFLDRSAGDALAKLLAKRRETEPTEMTFTDQPITVDALGKVRRG